MMTTLRSFYHVSNGTATEDFFHSVLSRKLTTYQRALDNIFVLILLLLSSVTEWTNSPEMADNPVPGNPKDTANSAKKGDIPQPGNPKDTANSAKREVPLVSEITNSSGTSSVTNNQTKLFYEKVSKTERKLNEGLKKFRCSDVGVIDSNPLAKNWEKHETFLKKYCVRPVSVLFVGMNPSSAVKATVGIAFGDPWRVPDFAEGHLGEDEDVDDSGTRFWGYMSHKDEGGMTVQQFFENCFVFNYCPLLFTKDEKNFPLDQIKDDGKVLQTYCDEALLEIIEATEARIVVGVGGYAHKAVERVLPE